MVEVKDMISESTKKNIEQKIKHLYPFCTKYNLEVVDTKNGVMRVRANVDSLVESMSEETRNNKEDFMVSMSGVVLYSSDVVEKLVKMIYENPQKFAKIDFNNEIDLFKYYPMDYLTFFSDVSQKRLTDVAKASDKKEYSEKDLRVIRKYMQKIKESIEKQRSKIKPDVSTEKSKTEDPSQLGQGE